jgi:hypothetical protein
MYFSERMRELMLTKTNLPTGDVPAPTRRMILGSIAQADVMYLAFPRLQRALVVDLRSSESERPALFITELMFTAGREVAMIERLRPGLPAIERFASVTWGGSTRAFAEQGILPAILNRLPPEDSRDAMLDFEQLREIERIPETRATRARTPDHRNQETGTS